MKRLHDGNISAHTMDTVYIERTILLRLVASGFRFMAHRHLENSPASKKVLSLERPRWSPERPFYIPSRKTHEPLEKGRSSHTANSRVIVEPIFGHLADSQRWKNGEKGVERGGGWGSEARERKEITSVKIRKKRLFDVRETVVASTSFFLPSFLPSFLLSLFTVC